MAEYLASLDDCVDRAIARVGPDLVLATPLGLGKPVQLVNAFYRRVAADPALSLQILTALSLERPEPKPGLEARLAGPIIDRVFGDYEELAYMTALRGDGLPSNIKVSEFYFKAGAMTSLPSAQQNYICSNYTQAARDLASRGVNVLVQLVATRGSGEQLQVSLSCNTDLTLDMARLMAAMGQPTISIGQVHTELPFMGHDALVPDDFFDLLVGNADCNRRLFAVPNAAIPRQDYATAMHASSLIADGGTLQIGIGALGDAVAQACLLREHSNGRYCDILAALSADQSAATLHTGRFELGLYASTEMFVNGMMALIERGVIKRRVYDNLVLQRGINAGEITASIDARLYDYGRAQGLIPRRLTAADLDCLQRWGIVGSAVELLGGQLQIAGEVLPNDLDDERTLAALLALVAGQTLRGGRILHAGFFLGPADFYQKLASLEEPRREQLCMTSVARTNQLLEDVPLYSAQRQLARFINTGMMVTLSGAVVSDALEDGTEISGVGGQYNFVAMAHDLEDARSILCIRSTRGSGSGLQSNILASYGHTTISRQLRDIIVTEYGVADLRGRSDAEVAARLLNVADSRFQAGLLQAARDRGRLPADYEIPPQYTSNTPQSLAQALAPFEREQLLPAYPFGTELTAIEVELAQSLKRLAALRKQPVRLLRVLLRAVLKRHDLGAARPYLERLQLTHPGLGGDLVIQQLLLQDLAEHGKAAQG